LQQHHIDLLARAIGSTGGRIVDTAGDGAFLCFPSVGAAVQTLIAFQRARVEADALIGVGRGLVTRIGVHWGQVLTDGVIVAGDAVNLCARLTAVARPHAIVLTKAAFLELPSADRLRCHALPRVTLAGVPATLEVVELEWRDTARFPT